MKRRYLWMVGFVFVFIALCFPLASLNSADFRVSDKTGNIVLDSSVETRNLFVSGNEVNVQAKIIHHDLFAAGRNISINSFVEQGSFIVGQTIVLKGTYGGNIFAAGQDITIDGDVKGDVFMACSTWRIQPNAKIEGDVHIVGSVGYFDGTITGSLLGAGSEWYVNGKVEQTVKIEAAKSLTVGDKANIHDLQYKAPDKATVMDGAVVGKTTYNEISKTDGVAKKRVFRFPWLSYLASLVFALIIVIWLKQPIRNMLDTIHQQFFASLGIGFAVLVGTPVAILLIFLTFLGYKVAIALLLVYGLLCLFMSILGGIWLGDFLIRLFRKESVPLLLIAALIGITLMQFISWIPYAGWIILAFLNIISVGGIMITLFQKPKKSA